MTDEERQRVAAVLQAEYGLLMGALGAAWSASLVRTSLYLGVLSAAGVALGFASGGDVSGSSFATVSLMVLPMLLFLGVATFVRLVQVQRESVVYLTGINRIRRFLADAAPGARPFLVLPIHDDRAALYRSVGTGMSRRPPRYPILHLLAQTQGIVGIVTAAVAASFAGLALSGIHPTVAWVGAAVVFVATVVALFTWLGAVARGTPGGHHAALPHTTRGHRRAVLVCPRAVRSPLVRRRSPVVPYPCRSVPRPQLRARRPPRPGTAGTTALANGSIDEMRGHHTCGRHGPRGIRGLHVSTGPTLTTARVAGIVGPAMTHAFWFYA
jgi:hypothetical protein